MFFSPPFSCGKRKRLLLCLFGILSTDSALQAGDFEKDVAPLIVRRCLECHKGKEPSGGLSLESRTGFQRGGESGAVVVPGKPDESPLLARISSGEMPPAVKGVPQKLPVAEQAILNDWIATGANWPEGRTLDLYEVTTDVRGGRDWWSFQPLIRPAVPVVADSETNNLIDAFILAELAQQQFEPAPTADARKIVRRMSYDMTGLPPSFSELEAWASRLDKDDSAALSLTAVNELADHFLASPHFGERWGRHWLDLVRYAESS